MAAILTSLLRSSFNYNFYCTKGFCDLVRCNFSAICQGFLNGDHHPRPHHRPHQLPGAVQASTGGRGGERSWKKLSRLKFRKSELEKSIISKTLHRFDCNWFLWSSSLPTLTHQLNFSSLLGRCCRWSSLMLIFYNQTDARKKQTYKRNLDASAWGKKKKVVTYGPIVMVHCNIKSSCQS